MYPAPDPRPGQVLLVAVSGRSVTLWVLGAEDADCEMGARARQAWDAARTAVLSHLPLLWRSPRATGRPPAARRLAAHVPLGACEHPTTALGGLDGASFGLAFALAQASALYGLPVDPAWAALGAVDGSGHVECVEDVRRKGDAILNQASWVRTLLVAKGNEDEAREVAWESRLTVVPVQGVREALQEVFGEAPRARLVELAQDDRARAAVIHSLFEMTLRGDRDVQNWRPVADASSLVLKSLAHPTPSESFRLEFARAVALRHQDNQGDLPVPGPREIEALAAPIRLEVLAHLVQHSADTGCPPADHVEPLARRHLAYGPDAFVEHLRLLGSLARLLAVTGRPDEALEASLTAVWGLAERMAWSEVSRPLCTAVRLSGVLRERGHLERLADLHQDLVNTERLNQTDHRFLALAFPSARVWLGEPASQDCGALMALATDPCALGQIRMSACRIGIRAARTLGAHGEAARFRDILARAASDPALPESDRRDAELFRGLARLDEVPSDADALALLRERDPGVIAHLERAAATLGEPAGAYVSRFYPY